VHIKPKTRPISIEMKADLERLEAIVDKHQHIAIEFCGALREIRDRRLYRSTHETFEEYCKDRWGFASSRARQLIAAADTPPAVKAPGGGMVPLSMRARSELAKAPKETHDKVLKQAKRIQAKKNKGVTGEKPVVTTQAVAEAVAEAAAVEQEKQRPPTKAEKAIAQAFQFTDLAGEVIRIKKTALAIAEVELGYELSNHEITDLCDRLASHLRAAAPHAPCPCSGIQEYCPQCHGRGWITKDQESRMEKTA
jgi:hypothetical protein